MKQGATTRSLEAYDRIRNDILAGHLRPGRRLPAAEMVARYRVSVGALREALARLLEQGLVGNAPQQGFFVTPVSKLDLQQLTEARCDIESLALRHAIAEGDYTWESEVLAAHHRLANIPMVTKDDPDRMNEEWAEAHRAFHAVIILGCRNPRLTGIANSLRDSAELYRRRSVPFGKVRDIPGEHQAIVDAILARDSELATERLRHHISLTTELLLEAGVTDETVDVSKEESRL